MCRFDTRRFFEAASFPRLERPRTRALRLDPSLVSIESMTSSGDLHPAHGGRFVAVRSSLDPLSYEVEVLLPEGERATATLRWLEGTTVLEPDLPEPWTQTEMLKLARVLGRTKQERMTRWRPKPERG